MQSCLNANACIHVREPVPCLVFGWMVQVVPNQSPKVCMCYAFESIFSSNHFITYDPRFPKIGSFPVY